MKMFNKFFIPQQSIKIFHTPTKWRQNVSYPNKIGVKFFVPQHILLHPTTPIKNDTPLRIKCWGSISYDEKFLFLISNISSQRWTLFPFMIYFAENHSYFDLYPIYFFLKVCVKKIGTLCKISWFLSNYSFNCWFFVGIVLADL